MENSVIGKAGEVFKVPEIMKGGVTEHVALAVIGALTTVLTVAFSLGYSVEISREGVRFEKLQQADRNPGGG